MGRELRRVPLDFDWPLRKVWSGFINPHGRDCPEAAKGNCHNGSTNAGKWLEAIARLIAMVGEQGSINTPENLEHFKRTGRTYPHPWLEEWGMAPREEVPRDVRDRIGAMTGQHDRFHALQSHLDEHPPKLLPLDSELAQLVSGLAGGRPSDYRIYYALIKAAGLDDRRWGVCKVCDGHGLDPEIREPFENWKEEPPPEGEGWQLWETVSEGSPVSPVFATKAEFINYLVGDGYSRKAAEAFCESGWVPSGMVDSGPDGEPILYCDIETAGLHTRGEEAEP